MTMISEALSAERADPTEVIHSAGYWRARNSHHHAAAKRARAIRGRLEQASYDTLDSFEDELDELEAPTA